MEDKTPLEEALSKEDYRVILEKHSMWYDEKVKPIKGKSFLENLNEYEPLDVKTFIRGNKEEKTDDKYWFYKKNYKHIIPFIFRKNRKLNFTYFIASKNKRINDIRDITTRLNAFYKNGTQKAPVKKSREKFFEDLLNKMKNHSVAYETYHCARISSATHPKGLSLHCEKVGKPTGDKAVGLR